MHKQTIHIFPFFKMYRIVLNKYDFKLINDKTGLGSGLRFLDLHYIKDHSQICFFSTSQLIYCMYFTLNQESLKADFTCFQIPQVFEAHLVVPAFPIAVPSTPDVQARADGYSAVTSASFWPADMTLLFLFLLHDCA